jgi:hypothetical protein
MTFDAEVDEAPGELDCTHEIVNDTAHDDFMTKVQPHLHAMMFGLSIGEVWEDLMDRVESSRMDGAVSLLPIQSPAGFLDHQT